MRKRDGRTPLPPSAGRMIDQLLGELAPPAGVAAMNRAIDLWAEAAGEPAAAHSRAASFAGSTLIVEADDSAWVQELSLRRAELLARLVELAGPGVKELRFVLRRR